MEHVVGAQKGVRWVAMPADCDRSEKKDEISAMADEVDQGDGVVVVVDMFGGSPSNLSLPACAHENRRILYGANLPMLIKLAKSRHMNVAEAVRLAKDAGRRYIDSQNISAGT